jgi:hypothetical protein
VGTVCPRYDDVQDRLSAGGGQWRGLVFASPEVAFLSNITTDLGVASRGNARRQIRHSSVSMEEESYALGVGRRVTSEGRGFSVTVNAHTRPHRRFLIEESCLWRGGRWATGCGSWTRRGRSTMRLFL